VVAWKLAVRAFSIHVGGELTEVRKRCVEHNASVLNLKIYGVEYTEEVKATGVCVISPLAYSEVLRLLLLSREPDLLYLDTDCWLVEPPDFEEPGVGRKSNWAMYSGNNPSVFASMLEDMKRRKKVNDFRDWAALKRAGAQTINAIHKWEIPWFKE
jgi:hypothetical protein